MSDIKVKSAYAFDEPDNVDVEPRVSGVVATAWTIRDAEGDGDGIDPGLTVYIDDTDTGKAYEVNFALPELLRAVKGGIRLYQEHVAEKAD